MIVSEPSPSISRAAPNTLLTGRTAAWSTPVPDRTPKQIGSALSWYLKARSIYPQSDLADAGAKRLTNEILPPDDDGTAR